MATIGFGTNAGTNRDDVLGGRVTYDEVHNHYTLDNVVLGRGGNDSIQSMILPISINDQMISFASTLDGGAGDDTINGNSAIDYMTGGTGNDALSGDGKDVMFGGQGIDTLGLSGALFHHDLIVSYAAQAEGGVTLANGAQIGGFEKFVVVSGRGDDSLDLSGDANALDSNFQAGAGNDILIVDSATRGAIAFTGSGGIDLLIAHLSGAGQVTFEPVGVGGQLSRAGLNVFCSEVERFDLDTGAGDDSLNGGAYADRFFAAGGGDSLDGGGGSDGLYGEAGRDTLSGGDGRDSLSGGVEDDSLAGGAGADTLVGGRGADIFVFASLSDMGFGTSADRITDFGVGGDKIALDQIVAVPGSEVDPGFAFVTSFSGLGAQVQAVADEAHDRTVISGRIAGDAITDFTIILTGLHSLSAEDFIL